MRPVRLLLVAGAALLGVAATSLWMPYGRSGGDVFIDIPRGTSTAAVADLLSDAGVVRYRWQYLAVRLLRPRARIHAGEYCFREPLSPWGVLGRLIKGDVFYYELTVPEGQNIFDIAASLDKLGAIGGERFLEAARDPAPIRDLAAEAQTLEGYLFPDTYRITRQTTAAQLCAQMTDRFRKAWAQTGGSGPVHAVVTLASLIEKETARAEERPLIASVFCNRLKLGMPLDCDPTAIYAALLDGRYRGGIYRSDLESRNRYNTYQHAGLPPGPIANPGLESLKAALKPAESRFLYFVARPDGNGAHEFSEKLEAHQRAVSKYRRANHKTDKARAARTVSR